MEKGGEKCFYAFFKQQEKKSKKTKLRIKKAVLVTIAFCSVIASPSCLYLVQLLELA